MRVWLSMTLLLIAAALLLPVPAIGDSRITLEVTLRESRDGIVLHMTLANLGPDPLFMYQEQLPWETPYSTTVSIMRWSGTKGTPLKEVFPIADSLYRPISIAPGQSLEGDYSPEWRFPEFPGILAETDVIVFWMYELRAKETNTRQRYKGALLIPRRKP
jgi:hypothetical protein